MPTEGLLLMKNRFHIDRSLGHVRRPHQTVDRASPPGSMAQSGKPACGVARSAAVKHGAGSWTRIFFFYFFFFLLFFCFLFFLLWRVQRAPGQRLPGSERRETARAEGRTPSPTGLLPADERATTLLRPDDTAIHASGSGSRPTARASAIGEASAGCRAGARSSARSAGRCRGADRLGAQGHRTAATVLGTGSTRVGRVLGPSRRCGRPATHRATRRWPSHDRT